MESTVDLATTAFVLPPDARVLGVEELSERLRNRIGPVGDGRSVITRPGHRVAAQLVAGPLARLLDEFRTPSRLTDAVHRFARALDEDPLETLALAFDALAALVESRLLVSETSPDASVAAPSLGAGQAFAGYEVEELVRSLDDSEVYRARDRHGTGVALKVSRDGRPATAAVLATEATMLDRLAGHVSPALVDDGSRHDRPYVAMEWCEGVPIGVAAQQARSSHDRVRLRRLVGQLFGAYARLHDAGVLHGDVHPGNCLLRDDGLVVLLDFGNARRIVATTGPVDIGRTGIPHFHDPQMAQALLAGRLQPAASPASEQYAIAVLGYVLLTGLHPVEAPAITTELLERIVSRRPRPFAARGVAAWPGVEEVLGRALAHEPEDRFTSVAALAAAFESAARPPTPPRWSPDVRQVHDSEVLATLDPDHSRGRTPRRAWFALRTALATGDAELLAAADVHAARLGPSWLERTIVAHVARARSDPRTYTDAIADFVTAASTPSIRAAPAETPRMLSAAAGLLAAGPPPGVDLSELVGWAREQVERAVSVSGDDVGGDDPALVHATLAAAAASVITVPDGLGERLDVFAERGVGDTWLWAMAHDTYGDERFAALAVDADLPASPLAGGLTAARLHQLTGDPAWIDEAHQQVEAAHRAGCPALDVALLVTEASACELAVRPPFPLP